MTNVRATELFHIGDIVDSKLGVGRFIIVDIDPVMDDMYGMVLHYNFKLISEQGRNITTIRDQYMPETFVVVGKCPAAQILFDNCQILMHVERIHDEYIVEYAGIGVALDSSKESDNV